MNTIKFISKTTCQVFIDKVKIGEVFHDTILKCDLNVGTYWVEIKDISNRILCEYHLEVRKSHGQILQNIDSLILSNSIDAVLNPVPISGDYCPIEHNGLWGFVDNVGRIVIPCIYYKVYPFYRGKALVEKLLSNEIFVAIIDTKGNLLYDWNHLVGEDSKQCLLYGNDIFYVFDKKTYEILHEYYNVDYDNVHLLIPVYTFDGHNYSYGFIDKQGREICPLVFDFVWNFEDNGIARVKCFGRDYYINLEGKLIYDICQLENCISFSLPTEPDTYQCISYKNGKYVLMELNWETNKPSGNSIDEFDRIFFWDENYHVYKKNGVCYLQEISNKNKLTHEYYFVDSIYINVKYEYEQYVLDDYFVFGKGGKFGIIGKNGNIIEDAIFDGIYYEKSNSEIGIHGRFIIVKREKKYALAEIFSESITMISDFEYDLIYTYNNNLDNELPYDVWVVKKEGKYGCINEKKEYILPLKMEKIELRLETYYMDSEILIIYKENGVWGIWTSSVEYDGTEGIVAYPQFLKIEAQFDDCCFIQGKDSWIYIAIRKENKWSVTKGDFIKYKTEYIYSRPINFGDILLSEDTRIIKAIKRIETIDYSFNSLEDVISFCNQEKKKIEDCPSGTYYNGELLPF